MSGTEYKQPLLSICIPTYNRAEILKDTLYTLVQDPAFSIDVEIIISDNASTDNTEEICLYFVSAYDNIFYYRNLENINDRNFSKVLSYARGRYIKLFNDTLRFKYQKFARILEIIRQSSDIHLLFFQNNVFFANTTLKVNNFQDFVKTGSFFITWIANFGMWRKDFMKLENLDKHADLKLVQVDWYLQLASWNETVLFVFDEYFEVTPAKKKGGYNILKVFIENYLSLFIRYINFSLVDRKTMRKEKYRLYKYFIIPMMLNIFLNPSDYSFDTSQSFALIFKYYRWYPYTYFLPFWVILSKIYFKLIKTLITKHYKVSLK